VRKQHAEQQQHPTRSQIGLASASARRSQRAQRSLISTRRLSASATSSSVITTGSRSPRPTTLIASRRDAGADQQAHAPGRRAAATAAVVGRRRCPPVGMPDDDRLTRRQVGQSCECSPACSASRRQHVVPGLEMNDENARPPVAWRAAGHRHRAPCPGWSSAVLNLAAGDIDAGVGLGEHDFAGRGSDRQRAAAAIRPRQQDDTVGDLRAGGKAQRKHAQQRRPLLSFVFSARFDDELGAPERRAPRSVS
jgi:hypothetical protein